MPVTNYERIHKFARRCGVTIPATLAELFTGQQRDPETRHRLAVATAVKLCRQLLGHGQREFHFYTLNDARLAKAICNALRSSQHSGIE